MKRLGQRVRGLGEVSLGILFGLWLCVSVCECACVSGKLFYYGR